MGIRWKFLILLMAIGLLPLAAVTIISQHETAQMGRSLSRDAINALDDIISNELAETARNYSTVLNREKDLLELTLYTMAQQVSDLYAAPPPDLERKIYLAGDYTDPATAPDDLVASDLHMRKTANGSVAMSVSYGHQDFVLPPGMDREKASGDIARLSRLLPYFKAGRPELEDLIFWLYASLKNGVHTSYPGHGDYPEGFDPRKRLWYKAGIESRGINWTKPYVDATTNRVIMTATVPVRSRAGEVLGLTGLDILLTRTLKVGVLSGQWADHMRSFIVTPQENPETGKMDLAVVAKSDYTATNSSWQEVIQLDWFHSREPAKQAELLHKVREGKSGYMDMDVDGVDSICAFSGVSDHLSVLLIIPRALIYEQARNVKDVVFGATLEHLLNTGITALAVIVLVTVVALWGSRTVTQPLKHLAWAVGGLAKGDFSVRVDTGKYFRNKDERYLVAQAFNDMVPQLEDRMRMSRDLRLAQEVQQNLLPGKDPDLPGFDISGKSVYCDETGGDYVDFIQVADTPEKMCVVVGDVTGHGLPAALLMATARAQLMSLAVTDTPLSESLEVVNRLLSKDVAESGRFMTLFCLELDARARTASWASAGHDPALLLEAPMGQVRELAGEGLPLGVLPEAQYPTDSLDLAPGQVIFIGTDGIWEARNPQGEMYGKKRLERVIRDNAQARARDIVEAVLDDLAAFRGERHQEDDVTMAAIKVLDSGERA